MALPERFERPTLRFVVGCSIQLSYGRLGVPQIGGGAVSDNPLFCLCEFYLFLRLQRRLCRGEACDGHAIGRRGNIIEARLLTECNGSRVASMLAANAKLDPWTSRSPHTEEHRVGKE